VKIVSTGTVNTRFLELYFNFTYLVQVVIFRVEDGVTPKNSMKLLDIIQETLSSWVLKIELAALVKGLEVEGGGMAFKAGEAVDHLLETYPKCGLCYLPSVCCLIDDFLDDVDEEGVFPDPNMESCWTLQRRSRKRLQLPLIQHKPMQRRVCVWPHLLVRAVCNEKDAFVWRRESNTQMWPFRKKS
jgi:hypothetical protein